MAYSFFIAGTDTDVGKTFVSVALLTAAKQRQLTTAALKPVSAGCQLTDDGLRNDDALALQKAITVDLPYSTVNPVAFEPPIAPHIAAANIGQSIQLDDLLLQCQPALATDVDFTLVEGAGGWRVPLNPHESLADLAKAFAFPVVLVVGMRLGCLNHALLTVEAIERDGLTLAGWVANQIDPDMPETQANLATLAHRFACPCLGHIPYLHNASGIDAVEYLDIGKLLD